MLHTLTSKQVLKTDLATLWDFVSSPKNLATITPDHMVFQILTPLGETKMHAGQIIEYYITPFAGIKFHWVTEITHVKDLEYFVDEQRYGPYGFWHHKHFLKAVQGGVEMTDVLHYKMPFGFLGRLIHYFFVNKKIKEIFNYRHHKLEELFNK